MPCIAYTHFFIDIITNVPIVVICFPLNFAVGPNVRIFTFSGFKRAPKTNCDNVLYNIMTSPATYYDPFKAEKLFSISTFQAERSKMTHGGIFFKVKKYLKNN